jgi:large subunit ribosomal protein L18
MRAKIRDERKRKWNARRTRTQRALATSKHVRLTVFRSARHIYAQLVDPVSGRTLGTVSTRASAVAEGLASTGNVEAAKRVGAAVAGLARQHQIEKVVFNRNGFPYRGRVKALAEAARAAGLDF